MPRTEFEYPINARGDFLRVRIVTNRGDVVDFVAQYEASIDAQYLPTVRYDGSHGRAHRDHLDWSGETVKKEWLPESLSFKDALNDAIADLETNWERYLEEFRRRRP